MQFQSAREENTLKNTSLTYDAYELDQNDENTILIKKVDAIIK